MAVVLMLTLWVDAGTGAVAAAGQSQAVLIDREQRAKVNPLVDLMRVASPSPAATPQGLPQDEALRLAEHHYRVQQRYHFGPNDALSSLQLPVRSFRPLTGARPITMPQRRRLLLSPSDPVTKRQT